LFSEIEAGAATTDGIATREAWLRCRHTQAFERSLMGLAKSTERLERWLFK
jgi:hypothetical protein